MLILLKNRADSLTLSQVTLFLCLWRQISLSGGEDSDLHGSNRMNHEQSFSNGEPIKRSESEFSMESVDMLIISESVKLSAVNIEDEVYLFLCDLNFDG